MEPRASNGRSAVDGAAARLPHVLLSAYACEPNKGSAPSIGWNWARYLSPFCRLTVLTRANNQPSIEQWLASNTLPNVRFVYVDVPTRWRWWKKGERGLYLYYAAWQWLALRAAREIHASDPFDLAHHVTFESIHVPIVLQRLPVPLVYGPSGGGEFVHPRFWLGGGAKAFAYEGLRALHAKTLGADPFARDLLRGAARILVTTPQTESFVPDRYRAKTMVMAPAGMQREQVRPIGEERAPGRRIYGLGRLVHWKGFHLAIAAFARVAGDFPDATYTILGYGPQQPRLEAMIREFGLQGRVRLERWLPHDAVFNLAAESDIFLLASMHDSGGVALLEAMASGKPVVCLNTGGASVAVTPECGIAVPVENPEQVVTDLAAGLTRLLADPAAGRRMGRLARERVLAEFVWERKAEQMLAVYRELLGEPAFEPAGAGAYRPEAAPRAVAAAR